MALLPLIYLIVRLIQTEPSRLLAVLSRDRTWSLTAHTVGITTATAGTASVIGVLSAVIIVRTDFAARRVLAVMSVLPLAVPSYVAAYTWLAAVPTIGGFWGTLLIEVACTVPLVTLPVAAALRSADPAVEEVARSLGQSPLQAFMRTTFPQILPAGLAGALLVALYTVSEYGTPALMNYDVLTRALVTSYTASFDRSTAFVYALVLVVIALAVVALENAARGRARQWRVSRGAMRSTTVTRLSSGRAAAAAVVLTLPAVVAIVVPFATLIARIINRGGAEISFSEVMRALTNTVALAGGGALLAVVLALPVGVLTARWRNPSVRALETASFTGNALPGVVVGLCFVAGTLALAPALYQTVLNVALAYAVLFLPRAVGAVRTATAAVPPVLEEAARSLGRNALRTWASVTLRITAPGVATGALLALVAAMKELPATLMLRPTGMDTLATEMWSRTAVSAYSEAAPFALALILVAALPAFVLSGTLVSANSVAALNKNEVAP